MGFLNEQTNNNKKIYTSARDDGTGKPITDVNDKDAQALLDAIKQSLAGTLNTQLTGSYAILKGEAFPAGQQNDTLLEYDESTGDSIAYKYISGAWREL